MPPQTSITDVLSGNVPVKVDVSINYTVMAILVAGIFIAVTLGVIIARQVVK